jgi:hypothetical protein
MVRPPSPTVRWHDDIGAVALGRDGQLGAGAADTLAFWLRRPLYGDAVTRSARVAWSGSVVGTEHAVSTRRLLSPG